MTCCCVLVPYLLHCCHAYQEDQTQIKSCSCLQCSMHFTLNFAGVIHQAPIFCPSSPEHPATLPTSGVNFPNPTYDRQGRQQNDLRSESLPMPAFSLPLLSAKGLLFALLLPVAPAGPSSSMKASCRYTLSGGTGIVLLPVHASRSVWGPKYRPDTCAEPALRGLSRPSAHACIGLMLAVSATGGCICNRGLKHSIAVGLPNKQDSQDCTGTPKPADTVALWID